MGGDRQKKSSSGFFSMFKMFTGTSKKGRAWHNDGNDYGLIRVWPSDDDKGNWGVAEPNIDMKADIFIRQYKKRFSESECYQVDPAADN